MTKLIRKNAPLGAEYFAIEHNSVVYYKTKGSSVYRYHFGEWLEIPHLSVSMLHKQTKYHALNPKKSVFFMVVGVALVLAMAGVLIYAH